MTSGRSPGFCAWRPRRSNSGGSAGASCGTSKEVRLAGCCATRGPARRRAEVLQMVGGRSEPSFRSALAAAACKFTASGPWFLMKAADPYLLADLEPGRDDTFLSRLDGEWGLAF